MLRLIRDGPSMVRTNMVFSTPCWAMIADRFKLAGFMK